MLNLSRGLLDEQQRSVRLKQQVDLLADRDRHLTGALARFAELLKDQVLEIIDLVRTAGEGPLLVLKRRRGTALALCTTVWIVGSDGALLGKFEVTNVLPTAYHARVTAVWDPLWWGYMHQQADRL
jgi:hypothetical protein